MSDILSTSEKCNAIEKSINKALTLNATGSWANSHYLLEEESAYALIAALTSGRPLLVQGEPGIGKSELARAAADLLKCPILFTVVQPDSTYQELLWDMDYTKRLADAQLAATEGSSAKVANNQNYIAPGVLWWAINWQSAQKQAKLCQSNFQPAKDINVDRIVKTGCVVLIDEVDKADLSFANGLLEVLANQQFDVPALGETVTLPMANSASTSPLLPLIVLTSNNTRQLPAAFLRRCVLLTLRLPDETAKDYLVSRGQAHYSGMSSEILEQAADKIIQDRLDCHGPSKTGVAEYLDLLSALNTLEGDDDSKIQWLEKLKKYFYKSTAG